MKDNGTETRNEAILYIRMYVHVHTQRVIIHVNMLCIHNMSTTSSWVALFPNLSHVSKRVSLHLLTFMRKVRVRGQDLGISRVSLSINLSFLHALNIGDWGVGIQYKWPLKH